MASFCDRLWPASNFRWGQDCRAVRVCWREQRLMVPDCFYAMDGSRTVRTAYDSPASKAVWLLDSMMPWCCLMPNAKCAKPLFVLVTAESCPSLRLRCFPSGYGAYEREMVKSYTGYRCRPWCFGVAAALLLLPLWHLTSLDITWRFWMFFVGFFFWLWAWLKHVEGGSKHRTPRIELITKAFEQF